MKSAALVLLSSSLLVACGAGKTDDGDGTLRDGSANGDGDNTTFDIGGNGDGAFDLGTGDGPSVDETSCAATTENASEVPLDLFIMQDQSGSMKDKTASGVTKWNAVKTALKAFLADPKSNGLGVGIQYFGLGGAFGSSCNVADYAKAEVEIDLLP